MASEFRRALARYEVDERDRRWFFLPYDQLSAELGPWSREKPRHVGIIVVESPAKAERRPYHKQKLALVLANLRHFALEQAKRGIAVRHVVSPGSYAGALAPLVKELGSISVMEPAERELRVDLAPLVLDRALTLLPHEGWLTTHDDFAQSQPNDPPWRMDAFYRHARQRTGLLMTQRGTPEGGRFSFDTENRKAWSGTPVAPAPLTFQPDVITREVGELVAQRFGSHPGTLDLTTLPATARDAEALWSWAKRHCLPHFGPYEDAMSTRSRGLFHTRVSALINLGRLAPKRLVEEAAALDAPLASREGFVRQILGWREFMRHVHRMTDGFRTSSPNAAPSYFAASTPLPPTYWGQPSGLACLDNVVGDVLAEGYSHHITRLMVLSNLATLLDLSPRALTDWFWEMYVDAYDWVVEPNVLMMGTYGTGPLGTTKPYISGAVYIDRMSDYCKHCAFNPHTNCPITQLYWDFLRRHEDKLGKNPRLTMPYASLRKRTAAQHHEAHRVFLTTREALARGEKLKP